MLVFLSSLQALYFGAVLEKAQSAGDLVLDKHLSFLAPVAVGQQDYVMVCCPSCAHPSIRVSIRLCVNFFLNIFFSESTYQILMKFHRNVPAMVLFRIS